MEKYLFFFEIIAATISAALAVVAVIMHRPVAFFVSCFNAIMFTTFAFILWTQWYNNK